MAANELELSVVYEDADLLVGDKPAGLLAVPIPGGNVINMLDLVREHCRDRPGEVQSVHRIDRYTSGLMVFAKNGKAYDHLFDQFRNHTPERIYLAIVRGVVEAEEGEYVHHLKLVKEGFRNIVVGPETEGAAPARLTYRVAERFMDTTGVEVRLDTGLKNQIRVQFEAEGHQLVGDRHYAPGEESEKLINRQALHAWKLSLKHPSEEREMTFAADIPADMLRLIDHYRWRMNMHS